MREDPNSITYFAATNARGKEIPFGIKRRDRARHMYVIGKTGMGKSTLLENMAIQDIRNGEGMAFIDPHGQTADRLLEYVPEHRIKDVVYFAPFDMDYPIAFNVMEDVGYDKRHLVVSGLLSAFRKIWVDAWSARMEYILSNTLLALLEYPGATLLDINRMLINKTFRKKVVDNVTDPIVKSFWVEEFANYTDRYTQDATPAIQNKVGQFTSNPLIRNIVGQAKSSFDIRKLMDEKKIIIMNLSKGRVGEVNATLLGSMLVTKIYLSAMSRADVPISVLEKLPNFYFYVDEFQSFSNQSFADILSEARKYKLNLIIAHQYIEQMEEEVRNAVFGNVGTTVAFRVGPFDAEVLETIFNPQFTATDLVNLGFAQIYLTLMIDGVGSPPFSATTLPPFDATPQKFVAQVLKHSHDQYAKPRAEIEEGIKQWQEVDAPPPPPPKKTASTPAPRANGAPRERVTTNPIPVVNSNPVPPPAPVTHEPREVHHAEAKVVAAKVAREHGFATSRAMEDAPRNPRPQHMNGGPKKPRQNPDRPPIEGGAGSLREALAMATRTAAPAASQHTEPPPQKQERAAPPPRPSVQQGHAPDLKSTLRAIVSDAPPEEPRREPPREVPREQKESSRKKAAEIPEQQLRDMLAVDGDE